MYHAKNMFHPQKYNYIIKDLNHKTVEEVIRSKRLSVLVPNRTPCMKNLHLWWTFMFFFVVFWSCKSHHFWSVQFIFLPALLQSLLPLPFLCPARTSAIWRWRGIETKRKRVRSKSFKKSGHRAPWLQQYTRSRVTCARRGPDPRNSPKLFRAYSTLLRLKDVHQSKH